VLLGQSGLAPPSATAFRGTSFPAMSQTAHAGEDDVDTHERACVTAREFLDGLQEGLERLDIDRQDGSSE